MNAKIIMPYMRFTRQVVTAQGANTQFVDLMENALQRLKAAPWVLSDADPATIALPFNDPLGFAPAPKYDTYKASSTVSGSGVQRCHAGMAAYRYKFPAAASQYNIKRVQVPICADKFAFSGLNVSLIFSDEPTPPTDWDVLRAGSADATTPDTTETLASPLINGYGILNTHTADKVTDASNGRVEYVFDGIDTLQIAPCAYLYVIVAMHDYTDYRPSRQYWIEGSGMVRGEVISVEYDTTDDIPPDPMDSIAWEAIGRTSDSMIDPVDQRITGWTQTFITDSGFKHTGDESDSDKLTIWTAVHANFCTSRTAPQPPMDIGGAYRAGAYLAIAPGREIYSVATARFFALPPIRATTNAIRWDAPIASPPQGMTIRYAIYHIHGVTERGALPAIDHSTYCTTSFWGGRATQISLGGTDYQCNCLLTGITAAALPAETPLPVAAPSTTDPTLLCVVLSVHDIQEPPHVNIMTEYGVTLDMDKLTLEV